jgi:hypothetical protein
MRALERALSFGIIAWVGLVLAGAVVGRLLSFGTGTASELPKWNGWSYLAFSAREGARAAEVLTWFVALVVFVVSLVWRR